VVQSAHADGAFLAPSVDQMGEETYAATNSWTKLNPGQEMSSVSSLREYCVTSNAYNSQATLLMVPMTIPRFSEELPMISLHPVVHEAISHGLVSCVMR
jgi:hypothetical protein